MGWRTSITFLRAQGYESRYLGVDIVPEFVALAQGATALDPDATAQHIKPNDALPMGYDYVMLSGVFNNKMDDNWGFMTSMLRQMFASAGKAIAFNAMTTHVDYHDDELYYVDPMDVVNFCKTELGGHPVLRHVPALFSPTTITKPFSLTSADAFSSSIASCCFDLGK